MTLNVVRLPTAATTFITVRRVGRGWAIELVTPCPGAKPLRTVVARSNSPSAAVDHALTTGERMHRPVRLSKALNGYRR